MPGNGANKTTGLIATYQNGSDAAYSYTYDDVGVGETVLLTPYIIFVCRRDGSADTYGTRWDGSSVFGETYFVRIKPLHQSAVQHLRGYIPRRCFVASKSDKIRL